MDGQLVDNGLEKTELPTENITRSVVRVEQSQSKFENSIHGHTRRESISPASQGSTQLDWKTVS